MASETCTTMIIHPDFKPDSPLESLFDTTSYEQSACDTKILVSEDQTYIVQPINAAKPENTLQTAFDTLLNQSSILESVLEPSVNPTIVETSDNILLSDSDEEDKHIIHIDRDLGSFSAFVSIFEPELDTPSAFTSQINQDIPTPFVPQPINVSPPPTLLLQSTTLREVCENIF